MNVNRTCTNCKFYSQSGCAVNPSYWTSFELLRLINSDTRKKLIPILVDCDAWQQEESKTIPITLLEREWEHIANLFASSNPKLKSLIEETRKALGKGLDDKEYDDIPF